MLVYFLMFMYLLLFLCVTCYLHMYVIRYQKTSSGVEQYLRLSYKEKKIDGKREHALSHTNLPRLSSAQNSEPSGRRTSFCRWSTVPSIASCMHSGMCSKGFF